MTKIDSNEWKLTCQQCGTEDAVSATQRGSESSIRSWRWSDIAASEKFDVVSKPGIDGPDIDSATCKKCKVLAIVT